MSPHPSAYQAGVADSQPEHAIRGLKHISDISRAINASHHPREILAMVVFSAAQMLDAELSWMGEFEGDSSRYRFSAAYARGGEPGVGEELGPEFAGWFELGHGPVGRALRSSEHIQLPEVQIDLAGAPGAPYQHRSWSMRATLAKWSISSVLIVPMLSHDRLLGFLGLGTLEPRTFSPQDVELLKTLADHSVVAIDNARLYERTREAAVAEERNRMAREIHDTLAQGFTGIVLQLEAAEQVLPDEVESALVHIARAKTLARNSLQEARRSVLNLRPSPLESLSLGDALLREVQELGATGIEANFTCVGHPNPVSTEAQTCVLRVCQEALTNTRRHARASRVDVMLSWEPDGLRLVVTDDGLGFDPSAPRPVGKPGGYGLVGMRERCQLQHGTLSVESSLGKGTTIQAFLPAGTRV